MKIQIAPGDVISYLEMCGAESAHLQRGMNFRLRGGLSVVLMSTRQCGSAENLHFDHILPFSKGGTSLSAQNIQLLCQNCNVQKSASIE
ncbi:MAG TPA: HNH endonuclease signature motif containing protein [Abditibacterium sp.]